MNENKDKEQKFHLKNWINNNCVGTIIAPTGVGKTRILVMVIKYVIDNNPEANILVAVPSERIRDYEIPNEIKKWAGKKYLNKINIECIQTAYKRINEHWDLIAADEVHLHLSDEHIKLYRNNSYNSIICLTATAPEEKESKQLLEDIAPIVSTTSVQRALDLGLISSYKIYNLPVSFTEQERRDYNKHTYNYEAAANQLGGRFRAFQKASDVMKNKNNFSDKDVKNAAIFFGMIKKRKELCFNAENKVDKVEEIVNQFPDRYTLIFGESIEFCTSVSERLGDIALPFHSKQGKKEKKDVLKEFNDKRTKKRVLVTARALDVGFNVEDISLCITAAGSSKQRQNLQRLGRSLRVQEGKEAIMVNLYVPGTQEQKWVEKRLKNLKSQWVENLSKIQSDIQNNQKRLQTKEN